MDFTRAESKDVFACAELYQNAFPEILTILFDQPRIDSNSVKDVLDVIRKYEPDGFWIVSENQQVIGFIMAVSDIQLFYRFLLIQGYPLRFLFRWVTGRYHGIRLAFLKRLWKTYRDYRHSERPPPALPMGQILSVVVDKSFQGQGIGSRLFEKVIDYLKTTPCRVVRLEVDAGNQGAIHVYHKFGFAEHTRFLSPRGDAVVMIKEM